MRPHLAPLLCLLFVLPHLPGVAGDKPLMRDFIGLNGHFHFKPALYKQTCRLARNYHNLNWDVKRPGDPITIPRCVNGVDWKRDVYGPWVKEGFEVSICAQFGTFGEKNEEYRDLWAGQESWIYLYGHAMAKAFGLSGARKLATAIEIGNEPGNDFDDALYQTLFRHMARGIRDADPKMKIVTATARSGESDPYAKSLEETFAAPDLLPLYDVINTHVYAVKPEGERAHPWERSYPEDPGIDYLKEVDALIAFRDAHAPGKEVWITEFGYDACTAEAMTRRKGWAKKLGWTGVTDTQQAQYLVRSILCFAERAVDRAYIYFYNDKDQASVHAASGLTRNFRPKPAFWAVAHLYATLGNHRFHRIVYKEPGHLHALEFVSEKEQDPVIWVAWSPTGSDRTQEVTLHDVPGPLIRAEAMPLTDAGPRAVETTRTANGGLTFSITENPVYVFFRGLRES